MQRICSLIHLTLLWAGKTGLGTSAKTEQQQDTKAARAWQAWTVPLINALSPSPHGALLVSFLSGAMSVHVLVPQDQVVTVSMGESVTFRCSMKGDSIAKFYFSWYRKTQGNTMTFIHREENIYGPGFRDRFQGKTDILNNQAILEVLKVSEGDEGSYYCASDKHPAAGPLLSSSKTIEIYTGQLFQQDHNFLLNK